MKTIENVVKSAIMKRDNVNKTDVENKMIDCVPVFKTNSSFKGHMLRSLIHDICGEGNYMFSGSRLLDKSYWASNEKDVDIFFTDRDAFSKVKNLVSMIAHKKVVKFVPHWYYNYDTVVEIGRYEVFISGISIQIDLVLVEKFISRNEARAMSLLKNDRWRKLSVGWNSWDEVLNEVKRQLA